MQFSVRYVVLFSLAVCGVCAVFVSSLAVALAERQDVNRLLDKKKNVLMAAGLLKPGETISPEEVEGRFASFEPVVIDLETGEELTDVDPSTFDQQRAKKDPSQSSVAPPNNAGVQRVPDRALVYKAFAEDGSLEMLIVPVEGYGLWSTLLGFLALDNDLQTVEGLAYYDHKETPGLGGEVDNPNWRAVWKGRQVFGANGEVAIEVIKGAAGPVEQDPHSIDGLAGATITARGVTNMMHFWLGEQGFGPYLEGLRSGGIAGSRAAPDSPDIRTDEIPVTETGATSEEAA
ncbi:MAG: Na(+)-translocating NADH-quinone reductase subunit C [Holophagales bacterium]|nr:Na(+)-translocating NADH-quinone reductase subunit C [Holophagales bacterium]